MKIIIMKNDWDALSIVILTFVSISIVAQSLVGFFLVFLAREAEFIDEAKRRELVRSNNYLTVMVLFTSIINIFISVFFALI